MVLVDWDWEQTVSRDPMKFMSIGDVGDFLYGSATVEWLRLCMCGHMQCSHATGREGAYAPACSKCGDKHDFNFSGVYAGEHLAASQEAFLSVLSLRGY